jgi:hypothetical protein
MDTWPTCIGTYEEGNALCDGEVTAGDCALRERCKSLRDQAATQGCSVDSLLRAPSSEPALEPKTRKQTKLPKTPQVSKRKRGEQRSIELLQHFEEELANYFGESKVHKKEALGKPEVVFRPGVFYSRDRIKSARELAWYCKSESERKDLLIVIFKLRVSDGRLDVTLPYTPSKLERAISIEDFKRLGPKEYHNGQAKCRCNPLDLAGIGFLAELIHRLDKKGIDPLPRCK